MTCENRERKVWCFSMPLKAVMAVALATIRTRFACGIKGWDVPALHDPTSDCQHYNWADCELTYIQAAVESCEVAS